jgi:hypothetical protein
VKNALFILVASLLFPVLAMGGEKEEAYLRQTMIPLAQAFLERIGQTNTLILETNQVKNYRVDWFNDRPGCTASLKLTNGCSFLYYTEKAKTEMIHFEVRSKRIMN